MRTSDFSAVGSHLSRTWRWIQGAALVAGALVGGPAWGQSLLQNPSFEAPALAPGTFAGFVPGQTIGAGWQVRSTSNAAVVVLHNSYVGGGAVWPQGAHGDQYLFLGDTQSMNSVSQDVLLQAGLVYRLDYWMATLGAPQGPFNGAANLNIGFRRLQTGVTGASQNSFIPFDASSGQFHNRGFEFECPVTGAYRLLMDNVAPGYFTALDDFNLRVISANLPSVRAAAFPAGATAPEITGLSGDSGTLVGWRNLGSSSMAFLSFGENYQELGTLGGSDSLAYAVNQAGDTIVGDASLPSGASRAFRWRPGVGMQNLGIFAGYYRSHAYGVSDDGRVVVGYCAPNAGGAGYNAFRWTEDAGMQDIGPGVAQSVSGDGQTVVLGGCPSASRWTPASGRQSIGSLGGCTFPQAVNRDGTVIVGSGFVQPDQYPYHMFRWTAAGGIVDLGAWSGISTFASDVTPDGGVIVGTAAGNNTSYDTPGTIRRAVVWTQSTGIVTLEAFLESRGVAVSPGWTFRSATGISDDGLTISGVGVFNGEPRPFRATIGGAGPFLQQPADQRFSGRPTGPVAFEARLRPTLVPERIRWLRQNSARPGEWVEVADGAGLDGMTYSGAGTLVLQASGGSAGWRRGLYKCEVTGSFGVIESRAAKLTFPLVTVNAGNMQASGTVALVRFPDNVPIAQTSNSASQPIPPSSDSFTVRTGGQTGGGFVGGSIAFECVANLNSGEGSTAQLSMWVSVQYFGCGLSFCYDQCTGSFCFAPGSPECQSSVSVQCSSRYSGFMSYTNNATGEVGSIDMTSYSVVVVGEAAACRSDFNGDQHVDPDDLSDFIACYFASPACSQADFNADGFADPDDLSDFIGSFFSGC